LLAALGYTINKERTPELKYINNTLGASYWYRGNIKLSESCKENESTKVINSINIEKIDVSLDYFRDIVKEVINVYSVEERANRYWAVGYWKSDNREFTISYDKSTGELRFLCKENPQDINVLYNNDTLFDIANNFINAHKIFLPKNVCINGYTIREGITTVESTPDGNVCIRKTLTKVVEFHCSAYGERIFITLAVEVDSTGRIYSFATSLIEVTKGGYVNIPSILYVKNWMEKNGVPLKYPSEIIEDVRINNYESGFGLYYDLYGSKTVYLYKIELEILTKGSYMPENQVVYIEVVL